MFFASKHSSVEINKLNNLNLTNNNDNVLNRSGFQTFALNNETKNYDQSNEFVRLGTLLVGIKSYINIQNNSFIEDDKSKLVSRNCVNDIQIIHSALLDCGFIISRFSNKGKTPLPQPSDSLQILEPNYSDSELNEVQCFIRNFSILSETIIKCGKLGFYEWSAFCNVLKSAFLNTKSVVKIIDNLESHCIERLPKVFTELLDKKNVATSISTEVAIAVPYFAKIFNCLSLIEKQFENDKPLKPTVLLFTIIYENAQQMLAFLNNRLIRFGEKQTQMSDILDCTVFATSIEIRKVYQKELSDISSIRQTPVLRSRLDAAYGLLRDCFQQNFLLLAQAMDSEIIAEKMFPNIKTKLEQSLELRKDLWLILQDTQTAEKNITTFPIETLNAKLESFSARSMQFLMFKDTETFQRFIVELAKNQDESELVSLLHRFGAYIETLFGQVNMRIILLDHPFEQ
jgi:hypothetical protein